MRSLFAIMLILLGGFIVLTIINLSPTSNAGHNTSKTVWHPPMATELIMVKNALKKASVDNCKLFFVKKFEGEEYVVACTENDSSWTYYVIYTSEDRVHLADKELNKTLTPPALIRAK